MDHLRITEERLQVEEATALVTSPSAGGISLFVGTTRNVFDGKKVLRLEYEAYVPMATREMKKICTTIREKWPDVEHIVMFHRTGVVPVCEPSVVIAVSSPHRRAAIRAAEHAIDAIKTTVPIWKKEFFEDGDSEWKANKECEWKP